MLKRFSALFLAVLLLLALAVPARADLWDGIKYNVTNMWDFLTTGTSDWNLRDSIGSYTGGTWMEKYANYVDALITGLGTDTIGENGYLLPVPATSYRSSGGDFIELVPGPPSVLAYRNDGYQVHSMLLEGVVPVTGNYIVRLLSAGPREFKPAFFVGSPSSMKLNVPFSMLAGDAYKFEVRFQTNFGDPKLIRRFTASVYLEVQPYDYSPDGFTSQYGGGSARPGNLDTGKGTNIKFGVTMGDGSVSVIGDVGYLFNEGNKTYYNLETNTYVPVTQWIYDYGDRTYNVDGESGEKVSIAYGDDVVTMVITQPDGSTATYIYSYLLAENVTPPAPDGGSGGGGEGGGGILGLLGQLLDVAGGIVTSILDLGSKIFNLGATIVSGLLDGLQKLLVALFMPKEESIRELETRVAEKLPFISDLQDFGDQLTGVLTNPAAIARNVNFTTVVDLGRKSGGVSYGTGQANLLDMTWYLDYKPLVDSVIEGVAWLVFLWNLYGAIPGIIHGMSSGLNTTASLQKWSDDHKGG